MARTADTAASNASNQYSGYATSALNNYNADAASTANEISSMEGAGNPYTSKSYLQNQNVETSGAMKSADDQAQTQLQSQALRTGTNTAALGRTIVSNARAGQRQMDQYTAGLNQTNTDKATDLNQRLIGDSQNLANSEASVYGTSEGGQTSANGQLVNLQDSEDQMWGQVIAGAAGAAGVGAGIAAK